MMRNSKVVKVFLIILTLTLIIPINVKAETLTYGDVLDELAKAKKELAENNASLGNTQNQIQHDNQTIKNLKSEIEAMKAENTKLQQEIADANVEIAEKQEQTKSLVAYLQMSQGENVYLEYVFGSDSITDMVYRLSIVEQITEYNDNMIRELEELITTNENKKVELAEKEEKSEQKIDDLNNEISKLNKTVSNLNSLTPSLKDEVKSKEELVAYYKSQGCTNRGDIIGVDCAKTATNAKFSRPVTKGYVTSFTGYRWLCIGKCKYQFHKGIDIGSSTGKKTPLYSIGNGIITMKWSDTAGALCLNVEYKDIKGKYYTAIYCHLSRYANGIYVGKEVTPNTILGYMGDTGNVTGVHLHLEVYPCRYGNDSNCKCKSGEKINGKKCTNWDKYSKFAETQFNSGYKGSESVINFPSRTYQTWYTR